MRAPANGRADDVRPEVLDFKPYVPGLSIDEIRDKYGLSQVIKLASNENPLGTSPIVQRVLRDRASLAFRYAQSGNPRLVEALSRHHGIDNARIVVGNGSDEIIDLIVRVQAMTGRRVNPEEFKAVRTVGDVLDCLEKLLAEHAGE